MEKMVNQGAEINSLHQDLIVGCKSGDQKAQFQIYRLYYRTMYNICLKLVNDTEKAGYIIQESFLSAFEMINDYSGSVSFGDWLEYIVIDLSLNVPEKKAS
jgi:RNA polymerase sigma-70 factor (ECF subfamily)